MGKTLHKPTLRESLTGGFILLILAVIAAGIFIRQFHYNPAVISHRDIMDSTATPEKMETAEKAETLPFPAGLGPMTPMEVFAPGDMYEKIDGKAELYLSAGVKSLRCRRFQAVENADLWMEVFVYEMETPADAFSVYSLQRRDGGIPTGLAEFSYQTDNAVFSAAGPYYLEIIGSRAGPEMMESLMDYLRHFIRTSVSGQGNFQAFDLFPEFCADTEKMAVISASAFGFNKFDNVFTSLCETEGLEIMLFLSDRGSPEEAAAMAAAYADFLKSFGGTEMELLVKYSNGRLIRIFDTYELFFTAGDYLCGVHEADTPDRAKSLAARLHDQLERRLDSSGNGDK